MICFPNVKINIGLNVLSRRLDGYHNIETIFYPAPFEDILEILPSSKFELINEGIQIDCPKEKNLCYKAFKLISERYKIPNVKIVLYKNVPFGTGLGAGSSDAAHTLILLNKIFDLRINNETLTEYASSIGADCAFFIKNKPVLASGVGNVFEDIDLNLSNKFLIICLPKIYVSTALAYKNCIAKIPDKSLSCLIKLPMSEWRYCIKNDFESAIFAEFRELEYIKSELYAQGAIYAQMSGSGSAIFGIFDFEPENLVFNEAVEIKKMLLA
jgi:4-diphosphocytidyl-2-C-methyl-D-erythritol kinase